MKCGVSPARLHVGIQLALKELPNERGSAAFSADSDHIADEHLAEARCEFGGEIANLIRVRKQHERWLGLADKLLEGGRESVGRVVVEKIVVEGIDAFQVLRSKLARKRVHRFSGNGRGCGDAQAGGKLLGRGERFK